VEIQGLDAMSAGVILAWATEMQEKDMISTKETGGLNLKWGDYETYIQAVRLIVEQPNDFYKALCRGVDYASSKYGGSEFALAFGGNEMPGYHTGPAAPISHLVSSRHSHLDSAGYSLDEKMNASGEKATPGGIAESLFTEEKWRQILSSLITCYFARGIFTEDIVVKTLKTVGYQFTSEGLMELGGEILKAKYNFKKREGFSFSKLRIPKRIFETPTPAGKLSENFIRESIGLFQDKIEAL
jgi:aldehyde:ferredoxin oxidoreductase